MPEVSDENNVRYVTGSYVRGEYRGKGGFGGVYKAHYMHLNWLRCSKEIAYDHRHM